MNLLQPLSEEMKNAFQGFQDSIVFKEQEVSKSTPFKRYVRQTLDQEIHKKEFEKWMESFEYIEKRIHRVPLLQNSMNPMESEKEKTGVIIMVKRQ